MVAEDLPHIHLKGPVRGQLFSHPQAVRPARHLRHAAEAEPGHDLPDLLRDKEHKAADILRFSFEAAAQRLVLRSDADRAGVFGADAHHHAAETYQRRRRKPELLRAEQGSDGHVSAAHQLAVRLQDDSVAQSVLRQAPVRLREAQLPGKARVVDGAAGRRAGSSVIPRDQDHLCARLGDAGRDGAYPRLGDQFHIDPCVSVGALEIVNELCQVLDGINIVMGRRRDQRHTGRRKSRLSHPGVHFFARKVAALAGLGALGHLDLDLLRAAQILAGDAEPP